MLDENSKELKADKNEKYFLENKNGFDEFCKTGWHIGMQTLMFRSDAREDKYYRDVFLLSDLLSKGKGYCLSELCSVYRIHEGGIHSGISNWILTAANIYHEIVLTFPHQNLLKHKYFKSSNSLMVQSIINTNASIFFKELKKRSVFQKKFIVLSIVLKLLVKKIFNKILKMIGMKK